MKFYRYEIIEYASHDIDGELETPKFPNPTLVLSIYDLLKETSKGYWIGDFIFKKWISKTSKKRFAYPTKEEALTNFIKRTEKRIKILDWQIRACKVGLNRAKAKEHEIQSIKN